MCTIKCLVKKKLMRIKIFLASIEITPALSKGLFSHRRYHVVKVRLMAARRADLAMIEQDRLSEQDILSEEDR